MATTVGQHSVASFTSPVNGTTPIDANTVRGNDNTLRSAYVDHDADTGIHVQSSTLASRPAAGTAGRKWVTADTGDYHLWYDDGSTWHEVGNATLEVEVLADENLAAGDVVKVTGFNNGQACPTVAKTTSASDVAFGIVDAAISINTKGYLINTGIVKDLNTNAYTVGTILYPNGSGGFTSTKPTSGNYQPCAYVLRQNTNNGVLYVEFSAPRIVESSSNTASTVVLRDASGNFSAGTITATTLAGTLSTAAQPNVTSVGTLTSLTVSGDLTVDTSTLKVDSTNNRVGVGTATPGYPLHVERSSYGMTGYFFANDGTSNPRLAIYGSSSGTTIQHTYSTGADALMFAVGGAVGSGTERARITAAGNFAIGKTTAGSLLDVEGEIRSSSGTSNVQLGATGTNVYLAASGTQGMSLETGGSTRIQVLTGGNVGINEVSPDYRLDVNGSFGFTPGTSVTPVDNGDVVIEATNNTTLTFKLKGSDGTVRTATLTLS